MYFYYFKTAENYKNMYKLIYITEINHFNSRLYCYCINNKINPLTVIINPNRVPPIIKEGQSYIKLLKEL